MKLEVKQIKILLVIATIALSIAILLVPIDLLEYLSISVVGEPPINGRTWTEGVYELGGDLSMRVLGILGLIIIMLTVPFILEWESKPIKEREVEDREILVFFIITIIFFISNIAIGYLWWDPKGLMGMGSLFIPHVISLVLLGLSPLLLKKHFNFENEDLATSTDNLKEVIIYMTIIAFGYGLISSIWHCCQFYNINIVFFYVFVKVIQLWAMCTFFFKYGLRLFLNKSKPLPAMIIISIFFGLCYPWHTWGFVAMFIFFGLLLSYLTLKTDSYIPGFILLYLAYIFHTALPWNGALITFTVIYPLSIAMIGMLVYLNIRKS